MKESLLCRIKVDLIESRPGLYGIRTKYEGIPQNEKLLFAMFHVPEEEREKILSIALEAFRTAFLKELSKRSRSRRKKWVIMNPKK